MNIYSDKVLKAILNGNDTQRKISSYSHLSLGKVNTIISELEDIGYISNYNLTKNGKEYISECRVESAVVLAAGFGLRMIPISNVPKALVEIKNEVLIERLIKQLIDKKITNVYVVVGYMKEKFDYLIDMYNVKLVVNSDYTNSNNIVSLYKTKKYINGNTYIIPADLYFLENPFAEFETVSYYTLGEKSSQGYYGISNKGLLLSKDSSRTLYNSVGLAYFNKDTMHDLFNSIEKIIMTNPNSYWEDAIFKLNNNQVFAKIIEKTKYYEINHFEDLKAIDSLSTNLFDENIKLIMGIFNCDFEDINNISLMKKGMTNKSFLFEVFDKKYIARIPGVGTGELINRNNEADVYNKINKYDICDHVIYINPNNGIKITEFLSNSHNCNSENEVEVRNCIITLRNFHKKQIVVNHSFDLKNNILLYENLMGNSSLYNDYDITKGKILSLLSIIDKMPKDYCLCHIDSIPDNFLINDDDIKLIDWEYAGMQDPHVDIAMFAIYAGYDKTWIDKIIDYYFDNHAEDLIRYKIYGYVAICGFLWSNWCEYKYKLGVEFGEYSMNQYRYAKDYSKIALEFFERQNDNNEYN